MDAYVDRPAKSSKPIALYILIVLVVILLAALGYYIYKDTFLAKKAPIAANSESAIQQEIKSLVAKIGKHIILPTGEEPTLATVTDINKVRGQAFFKNAKNGDKILIYTKARKAILYRPSTDKIIEVGPVDLNQAKPTSAPTASPSAEISPTPESRIIIITPTVKPSPTLNPPLNN